MDLLRLWPDPQEFYPTALLCLAVSMDGIAPSIVQGMPLPAIFVSQLLATTVLSIVFVLVALWRFKHIEL